VRAYSFPFLYFICFDFTRVVRFRFRGETLSIERARRRRAETETGRLRPTAAGQRVHVFRDGGTESLLNVRSFSK